jgi:predicted permease
MAMFSDLRYSLRSLAQNPLFAIVGILSLVVGIGANTAVFSLMDKILLESLPVEKPRELVFVGQTGGDFGRVDRDNAFSYPMFQDLRRENQVFSGMLAHAPAQLAFRDGETTLRVEADIVSGDFFPTLGIRPVMGRLFSPEDEQTPDGHPVIVISYGFWQSRFGGSASVLGKRVLINGYPMTVIGVAEKGFNTIESGAIVDLWAPLMMKERLTPTFGHLEDRRYIWLHVFGRLKPGVPREQAQAQLQQVFMARLDDEIATVPAGLAPRLRERWLQKKIVLADGHRGTSQIRNALAQPVTLLMVMVGFVLLIACANLANLLLARAASRRKEVAIRLSLGASRWRIVRQLLTECLVLAITGGLLGVLLAWWSVDLLTNFLIPGDRTAFQFIDGRVLAFTLGLSVLTGVIFGLAPALQATRAEVAPALKDETGSVSASSGHVRMRRILVVAQVALSLFLLVGASLFARTLLNLRNVNPGFRFENLIQFELDASLNGYKPGQAALLYTSLLDALAGRPGIGAVSLSDGALLAREIAQTTIAIPGYQPPPNTNMNPTTLSVAPKFFESIGLPLKIGRDIVPGDAANAQRVAVVNETFARFFFPNEPNVIGRTFHRGRADNGQPPFQIVGVVADSKYGELREEPRRMYYTAIAQNDELGRVVFYVRSNRDLEQTARLIRSEVARLDANIPVNDIRRMEETIDRSLVPERLTALLSAIFALLATLLAAMGLYGVMAYTVTRRTREIGIRVALGAERGNVIWLVMQECMRLTLLGLAIGLPLALASSRFLERQLFEVPPADLLTVFAAMATLLAVAIAAGYLPARRATRISPVRALRYE